MNAGINQGAQHREANAKTTYTNNEIVMNMLMDGFTNLLFISRNFKFSEVSSHYCMDTGTAWLGLYFIQDI